MDGVLVLGGLRQRGPAEVGGSFTLSDKPELEAVVPRQGFQACWAEQGILSAAADVFPVMTPVCGMLTGQCQGQVSWVGRVYGEVGPFFLLPPSE